MEKVSGFEVYTSYGRTAVYLSLLAINVKGREVILPTFTCATNLPDAIVQAGGVPVFIDVNKNSLEMILGDIKKNINSKTIAIVSHHYFGAYCNNIYQIDSICQEYNLFHIEDFAHCLGYEGKIYGSIAIFSFSKNLNNPGGGMVLFREEFLRDKALKIQKDNSSLLHEFVTNQESFEYLNMLIQDRECFNTITLKKMNFLIRALIKMIKFFGVYAPSYFYKVNSTDIGKEYKIFDTRMTKKQHDYIKNNLNGLKEKITKRREISLKLNKIIPSYLNIENNIFTNYAIEANDMNRMEEIFKKVRVKTRRVWPAFQRYWLEQNTENIRSISQTLLLVDVDCITEDKILKLSRLMSEN